MLPEGLYDGNGPPTEGGEVHGQRLPIPVAFAQNVAMIQRIAAAEKQIMEGLTEAGFSLDFGEDGSVISGKYEIRGGGYYVDVGCSPLIIEGKISIVQHPDVITCFEENPLMLADGGNWRLATGYDNELTSAQKILGDEVAGRCNDIWVWVRRAILEL